MSSTSELGALLYVYLMNRDLFWLSSWCLAGLHSRGEVPRADVLYHHIHIILPRGLSCPRRNLVQPLQSGLV
jgi:hypothetical protein